MQKKECEMTCKASECCVHGWLSKKFLGLCLGAWVVLFAVLPHTAHGVAWSIEMLSSVWRTDRVVVVEPVEVRPMRAEPMGARRSAATRNVPTAEN